MKRNRRGAVTRLRPNAPQTMNPYYTRKSAPQARSPSRVTENQRRKHADVNERTHVMEGVNMSKVCHICRVNEAKRRDGCTSCQRQHRIQQLPKYMFRSARCRAKRLGIPFDLTLTDMPGIPERCPILGIELKIGASKGMTRNSPSLDRIRLELGYVKGTVRVISRRANLLKNDATIEELEAVLGDMKGVANKTQNVVKAPWTAKLLRFCAE